MHGTVIPQRSSHGTQQTLRFSAPHQLPQVRTLFVSLHERGTGKRRLGHRCVAEESHWVGQSNCEVWWQYQRCAFTERSEKRIFHVICQQHHEQQQNKQPQSRT
jgi:hypothetical protein